MRVPKVVVRDAQLQAKFSMSEGYSTSACWRSAMVGMKWRYHRAKLIGVEYGFIKD